MDYQQIAVGVHLLGFALGLGGATVSDIMFFRALKRKYLSEEHYAFLQVLSKVIWLGMALLILSGGIIFAMIYAEQGSLPMLASPRWQTKLLLVAIILTNGFVFRQKIFPFLRSLIGTQLNLQNIGLKSTALAISGTISIVSWYSILVISQMPRTFRPHLALFLGTYLVLLVLGFLTSRFMITRTLR